MKKPQLKARDCGTYLEVDIRNGVLKIDKEDFHILEENSFHVKHWKNNGGTYVYENYKKGNKQRFLHRIIAGTPDGLFTDHINGDTLDNRRENLRTCTHSENMQNRRVKRKKKSSKYKGVFLKKDKYWFTRIVVNGKEIQRKAKTEVEAAKTYDFYAKRFFGEFAKLNFP